MRVPRRTVARTRYVRLEVAAARDELTRAFDAGDLDGYTRACARLWELTREFRDERRCRGTDYPDRDGGLVAP